MKCSHLPDSKARTKVIRNWVLCVRTSCVSCAPVSMSPRGPVFPCTCGASPLSRTQTFPFVPVYRFTRVVVCPGVPCIPCVCVPVFLCWCVPVSACCTCFYARSVPSYAIVYYKIASSPLSVLLATTFWSFSAPLRLVSVWRHSYCCL